MLNIGKKEHYGTLDEISLALKLGESSLRTAQSRYPKDFEKLCVGKIGATRVYQLEQVSKWHAAHNVRGRPKRVEQVPAKPKASQKPKAGKTKA